ncbi:MAG: hypothetical protein IT168_19750 [Bryobacterales bacterium]|nr:hypothetical protein [Bryobacterales bacterium]
MKFVVCLTTFALAAFSQPNLQPHDEALLQLLRIRRIHVEKMSGETANHVRDMIINSLQRSNLFTVTENPDRADAYLRGSAEDLIFTDTYQYNDSMHARVGIGAGGYQGSSQGNNRRSASASVGEQDSARTQERKHESAAAVRLVNKDGDVIWSTTKESLGAKFRGASADVADKIMRQLLDDYAKAKRLKSGGTTAPSAPASDSPPPPRER